MFHKVPAGAIEMLFDEQNQPFLGNAGLAKYLAIRNIRDNFKELSSRHACLRSKIEVIGHTSTLGRAKNPYDVFINLDSAIEITKKGVEKIQEHHQQAIADRENQIHALEVTNEEH